ncbi:MAG: hypothetical protein J0M35_21225 [Candidatus Obscuribacter phosphatis]|uniref:Uncharacterized protein n=1 Tax=Candidatus Obscuribacter phosphatis TaxID=1906157 RepID=A0A8J7PDH6_9BACT|nr:hypothetical protein [Candidatus Obscuribacter phosphatis]
MTLEDLVFSSYDSSRNVHLQYPLTEESLGWIKESTKRVVIPSTFEPEDYVRVAAAMERSPNATLAQIGYATNLDFLRFFPNVTSLDFAGPYESLAPLKSLTCLQDLSLTIGNFNTTSLDEVVQLGQLRRLHLRGNSSGGIKTIPEFVASFESLNQLPNLQVICLTELKLPHLRVISSMPALRSLHVTQCSIGELADIGDSRTLLHLHIGYSSAKSIDFLSSLFSLQYLSLDHLSQIDHLPAMSALRGLRRIDIINLSKLTDLSPIASCPVLEDLVLVATKNIGGDDFRCFQTHPTLKHVWTDLGSQRRNSEVHSLLGLPRAGARSRFAFRI